MTNFADLGLRPPILRAIEEAGYKTMTPIQDLAIPAVMAGKDMIGVAQTGTGKTAAFSLPMIHLLASAEGKRKPKTARSLIIAPTRELAIQISENIQAYSKHMHFRTAIVYGGASSKPQIKQMMRGVDILIATPGRLLDLTEQKHINLREVEFLVLDEADRMLDMGFIRDIKKIVAYLPRQRQTVLFSATMPASVTKLANSLLRNPVRVEVAPAATTAEKVDQHVLMVPKGRKRELLKHVLKDKAIERVLIFTRTKHGANKVARFLDDRGIRADAIHGNKSQNARQKALANFREGKIRALVATDVAARGIDVDGVTHVINFEIPNEPESYVHRIGRTARAGATGVSLSFCDHTERAFLRDIEKTIRQKIPLMMDHPFHLEGMDTPDGFDENAKPANNSRGGRGKPRSGGKPRRPQGGGGGGGGKPSGGEEASGKPRSGKPRRGKSGGKSRGGSDHNLSGQFKGGKPRSNAGR